MKALAIVPAFNEEESIENVIKEIKDLEVCDILVINDCSKDNTSKIAKKTGAKVVNLINNLGIGGAVQTGYKYASEYNYQYVIQIDGDGQHDPKYIKEMIKYAEDTQTNIVIGSRFVTKTGYKQTFLRKIGGKFISKLIKVLSGQKIYDPLSGYRLVDRKIIKEFAEEYPYDYPEPETNLSMSLKGYKIAEIPMEMRKREHGKSSFAAPFTAIWYMIKVSLALIVERIIRRKKK